MSVSDLDEHVLMGIENDSGSHRFEVLPIRVTRVRVTKHRIEATQQLIVREHLREGRRTLRN